MGAVTDVQEGSTALKGYPIRNNFMVPESHVDIWKTMANRVKKGLGSEGTMKDLKEMEHEVNAGQQTWKEAFVEFTQNTTLHGVREITEDQPFNIRR